MGCSHPPTSNPTSQLLSRLTFTPELNATLFAALEEEILEGKELCALPACITSTYFLLVATLFYSR